MVESQQLLCRLLTSFLIVGFSHELDWRPCRWEVASLRSKRGSGRG